MSHQPLLDRLFEALIAGDRPAARLAVAAAEKALQTPERLVHDLFWPTHQTLERLFRADQLSVLNHHSATRLLRVLIDQNASRLTRQSPNGRSIFAMCGPSENEELGAQMAVDLLESAGFSVCFAGGGIPADEVLARVNESQPDVLLAFCSAARDLPEIRGMIDHLREVGACERLQIAVGGGVFNRAEGLAEEIGADVWANSPLDIVETLLDAPDRRAVEGQRTVGKAKKRKVA